MPEPTLTAVFGSNAVQDAATLTISKADLVSVGLTASATNTAESLLAAISKLAANSLTVANQQSNPGQHVSIQYANATVYESAYGTRMRQNMLLAFDNDFVNPGINPDNY
jgi:hypothetical protein